MDGTVAAQEKRRARPTDRISPAQVMAGEYAAVLRRLRVGGRWVQVAPSKSRYSQLNAPSFRELAVLYDR